MMPQKGLIGFGQSQLLFIFGSQSSLGGLVFPAIQFQDTQTCVSSSAAASSAAFSAAVAQAGLGGT